MILVDRRIVVIEDDDKTMSLIKSTLERGGFNIKGAHDGPSGLDLARKESPDLVILDLMLPGMDGFQVLKNLRICHIVRYIPVIILTARAEGFDKILGLELGADDYITKPFSPRELLARVKTVLRAFSQRKTDSVKLIYREVEVDTEAYIVKVGGREVELTPKEFCLLVCLIRNKGHVISRKMILESVWGLPGTLATRTVDMHVLHLRKKIPSIAKSIQTVKQFGYKLKEE